MVHSTMQNPLIVTIATALLAILYSVALGTVGVTQVTPDRANELSGQLHVAVGAPRREPSQCSVFISGPKIEGVVVSATLILADGKKERLRVPIRIDERPQRQSPGGAENTNQEWYLSCRLERALAMEATIDVLLDRPKRDSGAIYRVALRDFLRNDGNPKGDGKAGGTEGLQKGP